MYRQRDNLQIELEKIENEKRLNAQRLQIEQQRINNDLRIKLESINNQVNYRYMQNTNTQRYSMYRPLLVQNPQIAQTCNIKISGRSLNHVFRQRQQINMNLDINDYIKLIYDFAKQILKQLNVKVFLTPEEQYYYSELKDTIDFIEAGEALRNTNESFISKLHAAHTVDSILRKYFHK